MSAASKILSEKPSELELQVGQALIDLENSAADLKAQLRPLQLKSVREVCLAEIFFFFFLSSIRS